MESLGTNNGGSGVGGKRKIEDQVELAKQKAQAIAARLLSDADSKRPRTLPDSSSTTPDYSSPSFTSSHSSYPGIIFVFCNFLGFFIFSDLLLFFL